MVKLMHVTDWPLCWSLPDTGSKSLSLRILHLEPLFSLKLARCIHVEGESPAEQLALFLNDQSLQEGDSVQVFAPWWVVYFSYLHVKKVIMNLFIIFHNLKYERFFVRFIYMNRKS